MSLLLIAHEALLAKNPSVVPEVLAFLRQNRKEDAVRLLQAQTRLGLSDALDLVDHHLLGDTIFADCAPNSLVLAVHTALQQGGKTQAFGLLRAAQKPIPAQVPRQATMRSVVAESDQAPLAWLRNEIMGWVWAILICGAVCVALLFAFLFWFRSSW